MSPPDNNPEQQQQQQQQSKPDDFSTTSPVLFVTKLIATGTSNPDNDATRNPKGQVVNITLDPIEDSIHQGDSNHFTGFGSCDIEQPPSQEAQDEPDDNQGELSPPTCELQHEEVAHHPPHKHLHNRWILFLFSFGTTSLVAGVVYGWPALRRQLLEDGSTLSETQLGAIYTAGSWSAQGGRFFTGLARDVYGTRIVACCALMFTCVGAIGIAVSDASNGFALGVSLFVMSLGAGCQLVTQPVGSLFPNYSNAIISSLSGSFQISGLVFLGLASLPHLNRRQAFLGYAAVVAVLTVLSWFLLPATASFLPPPPQHTSTTTTIGKEESATSEITDQPPEDKEFSRQSTGDNLQDKDTEKDAAKEDDNQLLPSPATKLQQLGSAEFIGLLSWFSICLIPLQYYVGSIGFQLEQKGDDDGFYSNLFSIVYAASAVVSPLGGYLSDLCGLGWTQGVVTIMVAMSFLILGSNQIALQAQAAGLVLYGVGRMLIFGMFFSNIGGRFGYHNFGTLSGVGLLASAIVSLIQYPLIATASRSPEAASVVNFSAGAVLFCLTPYCVWLALTERRHDMAQSLLK